LARIALDAMGGDLAPQAPVAGALLALAELPEKHRIQLVGRAAVVNAELDRQLAGEYKHLAAQRSRIDIIDAPDVIEMTDKPTAVIRGKPKNSMSIALEMQARKEKASDAFVSAGNTGAQMAASLFILKLHQGVTRSPIVTLLPTMKDPVVLLDSGANVDCSPEELVQFARLGCVYAEDVLGRVDPAVGLLSIGEEAEKGNTVVKEAHQLLAQAGLNFAGNVEGRDILTGGSPRGRVDVVVCDGFVGNVLLKFYESVPALIFKKLESSGVPKGTLAAAFQGFDYSDYGGAPLLGVNGISIISHGRSSPRAIKNAIGVALRAIESSMDQHITDKLGHGVSSA
jgi:glycerol-3-phosphate acyltransferase PlsX